MAYRTIWRSRFSQNMFLKTFKTFKVLCTLSTNFKYLDYWLNQSQDLKNSQAKPKAQGAPNLEIYKGKITRIFFCTCDMKSGIVGVIIIVLVTCMKRSSYQIFGCPVAHLNGLVKTYSKAKRNGCFFHKSGFCLDCSARKRAVGISISREQSQDLN